MRRILAMALAALFGFLGLWGIKMSQADELAKPLRSEKPQWQRLLQGEDARKAAEQEKQLLRLQGAGKLEDALKIAESLVELRATAQGANHWQTESAQWKVKALRHVLQQEKPAQGEYARTLSLNYQAQQLESKSRFREAVALREKALALCLDLLGEEYPSTATSYNNLAVNLKAQGKYAAATEGYRKALAIRRRVLGEEHPDTATSYNNLAGNLDAQGKFAEAEEGHRKALDIYRKVLGEEHPSTAAAYHNGAANLNAQGKYAAAEEGFRKALDIWSKVLGEEHPDTAQGYNSVAANLHAQGKYAEAEEGLRKALAIRRKVQGEEHPDTAQSYNNVAANLDAQGKYAAAEESYRKALSIRRKVQGEEHSDTAVSYNNVAYILAAQGKYAEAEEGYRKALAIWRKVLGEDHPHTAISYNNVADSLYEKGKYAELEQGYRKALAILRKVLGEDHPHTAGSYNNVAANLNAQGKYAAAEEGYRKALAIRRRVLGEEHPDTATSYNNLASNLNAQRKYAAAEEGYRKALALRLKVMGEKHPDTAAAYNNLAANLNAQGKYAAAEEGYRKALGIWRKVLGEEHPTTATSYGSVAFNLQGHGEYAAAEEGLRKALDIWRTVLGEEHPTTAIGYNNVAANLHAQGKYDKAETIWLLAADAFSRVRPRISDSGLDRAAKTSEQAPFLRLAAVLARNGKPTDAWDRFEESLSRGTWDDLSARLRRPPAEQAKQAQLIAQFDRLDQLVEKTVAVKVPTPKQTHRLKDLLTQYRKAQDELDAFVKHLEKTYGHAGKVSDRATIQAALPGDTALIAWLDIPGKVKAHDPNGEHWAILLRSSGDPVWVRLRGTGPKESWIDADTRLPRDLRAALQSSKGNWQPLAQRLRKQRLEPLAKHLAARDTLPAVRQLIVLPSTALAGVPVEVFAEGYTVSYAHSGTLFAHVRKQPKPDTKGLFALADPVFDLPRETEALPLPKSGVLLTMVAPGSNTARAGLKPNDVLLRYHQTDLDGPKDLKLLPESDNPTQRVAVTVWRLTPDGPRTRQFQVLPGKLGVVLASEPAPKALAEQRRFDKRLASASRGGDWSPLPGTRVEVEALRRLFPENETPKLLFDSQASEQQLYDLAKKELGQYRYVHLATHGEIDDRFPMRSGVILSRDDLPDAGKQLDAGQPVFTGRLTVDSILRHWNLKSELVTLSACQTALGKYERGEGFVGFAQALTLAGSRSVCLSLWKVDDAATALLMDRFYQNLLGKREGLKAPLPKALALKEAKEWLRILSRDEAVKRTALLSKGIERGKGRPVQPLLPAVPTPEAMNAPPYAHPYYWAAFVLIGDPD